MESSDEIVFHHHCLFHWRCCSVRFSYITATHITDHHRGWDQTGSNGANLSFPVEFGIGQGETEGAPNRWRDNLIVGVVNAGPYIGSAFMGCWLSDPCNYYFGRRGTIFISAVFCLLTPIGGALSQTWYELFITRLLM
jgi:MFS family permease